MSQADETSLGPEGVGGATEVYGPARGARRTAGGALADLRLLGHGDDDPSVHVDLAAARATALKGLLTSESPKDRVAGLRYYGAYERERRELSGSSMEYAARVAEAEVTREVAGGPAETGATPEALSREVSEIVRKNGVEAAGSRLVSEDAPSNSSADSERPLSPPAEE